MAPLFITFEGIDGSGKSTHLEAARAHLEALGRRTVVTHEPGGTALGERLRAAFLDPERRPVDGVVEALVVFASRRQHLVEVIEPALAAGADVLCDRFTDSTVAYQGFGRGMSLEAIEALDRLATGGRRPDLTLLFDLPAERARRRAAGRDAAVSDRLDREDLAFYGRVRDGYLALARREPRRVKVIDSGGEFETAAGLTRRAIDEALRVAEPASETPQEAPERGRVELAGGQRGEQ